MKFRPLHDRVVVKRIDAEEKSAGGIIIPDTAEEKPSQGEVIAVGPGGRDEAGKLIPIDIKIGDRVLFGKWSGTEVKIDGQELLDHEGVRHHGRDRRAGGQEEGRITNTRCFTRRSSRPAAFVPHGGMTTTGTGETSHGCQGSQIFG